MQKTVAPVQRTNPFAGKNRFLPREQTAGLCHHIPNGPGVVRIHQKIIHLAHMIISESIPSKDRGKLVLSAFGFQAVGALVGTAVGYLVLYENPVEQAWRWMYATAVVPALLVLLGRFFIPDSGHWLVAKGRVSEAERELGRLLRRNPL